MRPDGFRCLALSIAAFTRLYDCDAVVCHNCPPDEISLLDLGDSVSLFDQREWAKSHPVPPKGVAWKLYPPRLDPDRHELLIDNDLIIAERIPELDAFLSGDCTLVLEETGRTYGRFDGFVPPGRCVNSGLFGMPPGFDLKKYVDFHVGGGWEENARYEHAGNVTWDEQGLVALALLSYPRCVTIPRTSVTNCEHHLVDGRGYHFIGLNRRTFHAPFRLWCSRLTKLHL